MKSTCIMTSLVCVAMLSACATTSPPAPTTLATSTSNIRAAMAEANAAALSGRPDKAYVLLKQATVAYPVDKAPWVRMAQMRFDSNNYGEAIVNALEALRRDPDDTMANSVVAVSGLRLSSKALADLTRKNNLSGTVRSEAQDLAKLLRNSLNEDVLVGSSSSRVTRKDPPREKKAPPASTTTASASGTQSKPATAAGPFGALK